MEIKERIAYLKGLCEGLGLDDSTVERRIILELVSIAGDLADAVETVDAKTDELYEDVESIDSALEALADELEDGCVCGGHADEDDDEDDEDEDEDSDPVLDCPVCGEPITVDADMLDQGFFLCPHCGEKLEIDEHDEHEEHCDCGHEH